MRFIFMLNNFAW